jgi:hypothetical protein
MLDADVPGILLKTPFSQRFTVEPPFLLDKPIMVTVKNTY